MEKLDMVVIIGARMGEEKKLDCGIFVLGYHRAIQTWMNTHLPSHTHSQSISLSSV